MTPLESQTVMFSRLTPRSHHRFRQEIAAAPAAAGVQTTTAEPSGFLSALRKELRPKDQAAEARIQAAVDTLAQRFGLGNTDLSIAYALVAGKDKDACVAVGQNLVCGSSFGENLSAWSPQQFFRIVRRLSLLPDRLGVIDCAPAELLLFFAACCQLIGVPTPSLAAAEKSKLDEKVRNLDRAIARKEKNGLRGLSSRMSELAGENGKNLVLGWQRTILRGSEIGRAHV